MGGDDSTGNLADQMKQAAALSGKLRSAGAHRLFVVVNPGDLPGPPVMVAPLAEARDGAAIGRLLCGQGEGRSPLKFPACETIHDAVVAGSPAAIERIRKLQPTPRPELASRAGDGGRRDRWACESP